MQTSTGNSAGACRPDTGPPLSGPGGICGPSEQFESAGAGIRPDVLGGLVALHGDGSYTNVIYFSSEAEARKGEEQEPPAELQALMEQQRELREGEVDYFDLTDPWPDFRS